MTIREIRDEDWAAVDEVQRMAFMAEAVEDIATIRGLARLSPQTCLLAESAGVVSGYFIAHPWIAEDLPPLNTMLEMIPPGAKTFFVHDLALRPNARGGGIASRLVEAGFAAGRRQGLRDAALLSIQGSGGFWERMGFLPRPDLAERVRPVLERFVKTDFIFMTRADLDAPAE